MMDRGTGKTTRAMQRAVPGAVYIWCNDHLFYPKILAKHLRRDDLKIVGPYWLESGWIGQTFPAIVIDHATELSQRQYDLLEGAFTRCRQ